MIDVFSKYGWIVPLKTKSGKEIAMLFQKLFTTTNASPSRLWTEKGTEFYNQQLRRVLTANNVTLYSKETEEKSSVVERWNRTMKNIMWKYFIANNTEIYRRFTENNNTYHRSIKLKPTDARKPANYKHINNALYANVNARKATLPKFHVGDKVCIVRKKGTF